MSVLAVVSAVVVTGRCVVTGAVVVTGGGVVEGGGLVTGGVVVAGGRSVVLAVTMVSAESSEIIGNTVKLYQSGKISFPRETVLTGIHSTGQIPRPTTEATIICSLLVSPLVIGYVPFWGSPHWIDIAPSKKT